MEDRFFTANIELSRHNMQEYCSAAGTLPRRWVYFACFPAAVFLLLGFRWIMPDFGLAFCWMILVVNLIAFWRLWRGYQRILDENIGKPPFNKLTINSSGIRYINPYREKEGIYRFGDISSAWRSKNLLYLSFGKQKGQLIDLRTVGGGTPEELMAFIRDNCPHWKKPAIPRRVDRRIPNRILAVLAVIGILTSFRGTSLGSVRAMDVRTAAQTLSNLDIRGINEDMILEIERFQEEYGLPLNYNAVPDLLYYAGAGEYDPEDWSWTPAQNGVYTFDLEAWEVSMMYTDLLAGISAMSDGALEFTDVAEDNSAVDWEQGTGTKRITFTFRGERHTLWANVMHDWYDDAFLNQLAGVVNRTGSEKQLYYLITESQLVSVFYRDPQWAWDFRDMTGYSLVTEIVYY